MLGVILTSDIIKDLRRCANGVVDGCKDCRFNTDYDGAVCIPKIMNESADRLEKLESEKEKYRWHDLRKDPDDLPKEDGTYYCAFGDPSNIRSLEYDSTIKRFENILREVTCPTHWKYIEPRVTDADNGDET